MKWLPIAMIIVIVMVFMVFYPHYIYSLKPNENIQNIKNIEFHTGDIIMMSYIVPKLSFFKLAKYSGQYYHQRTHHTHCGIIVIIDDIPYIYHLHRTPYFDEYTQKIVVGKPVLSKLDIIDTEDTTDTYLYSYTGPKITVDETILQNIYSKDIHFQPSSFKTALVNGTRLLKNHPYEYMCTDFVEEVLCLLKLMRKKSLNSNLRSMLDFVNVNSYDEPIMLLKS